jgi:hypothetical protein
MRNKAFVTITVCILLTLLDLQIFNIRGASYPQELELKLTSSKPIFNLGEIVYFDVEVVNKSPHDLSFLSTLNEGSGFLNIFISRDGNNFRKYSHSKWGIDDTFYGNVTLKPNGALRHTFPVFWNKRPNVPASLAADVVKRASREKILTDYAFPEAGHYYIQATYSLQLTSQSTPITITSEPIELTVAKPVGDDLNVWNLIKDNGDIAYFIQEGETQVPFYKTEERKRFEENIEQILTKYPNSFYARSLRRSLTTFQANEAKRRELMEKYSKRPNN